MITAQPMRVAVTGSTGMVGSALIDSLKAGGHQVIRLVREAPPAGSTDVLWDPARGELPAGSLEGVKTVVHLAGENIGSGRWSAARKREIRDSRVEGTRLLSTGLADLERRPEVLLCASAIGIYGDRGDQELTEDSSPGKGFLVDVCKEWEAACEPARKVSIRVVHLRFGVILSRSGGALARMLTPFQMGAGGRLGHGRQFISWISLSDAIRAIEFCLAAEKLAGPINAVSPNPVSNADFTKTLGHVLGKPTVVPMPAFMVKTVFGEMGQELLLSSARVVPTKLQAAGFSFQYPQLEDALRHELNRPAGD